nr:ISL3 family transposase [Streptomyces sp. CBMA29]
MFPHFSVVLVELTVRRLYCENADCLRRTFVEQVEGLTVRYGRRTPASRRILEAVAVALAGRAGSRFAVVLGSVVSRTALLRRVMALPDPHWPEPGVLGVDDFATRRGQHYGTVIIDCATGRPLDLLPGRDAKALASWLRKDPGVEIICGDRGGSYADGARTGAPQAVQIADRFHIWQDLGTAVKTSVRRHNACLRPSTRPDSTASTSAADPASTAKAMSPIEARIRERHTAVHALFDQGHGIREIARELHIGGNTDRRTARAEAPEQLLAGRRQPRPGQLDPYKWMMRQPDRLRDEDRQQLAQVLARGPEPDATSRLVRGFAEILTIRSGQHLKGWITAVRAENVPGLHRFATGLEKDWDAVTQGLTSHWNSGPVEGHVNHIKMIKRQMFGRAKLPLLRKRVLVSASANR